MPRDWDNHDNKSKKERVSFPYEINLLLDTMGQNSRNNGFDFIFQKILQASYSYFVSILLVLCSLD